MISNQNKNFYRYLLMEKMDRQIILDCQTDKKLLHCEDCVLYRTCNIRKKDTSKRKEDTVVIFSSEDSGVWETWKKRKSLPT